MRTAICAVLALVQAPPPEHDYVVRERRKIAKAEESLRKDPADAKAALEVGSFFCFVAEDWKSGLVLLEKGSDEQLKVLASRDLGADQADPEALAALGDAWWAFGAKRNGTERLNVLARAVKWYSKSLPGLGKAKAKGVLDKIDLFLKARGPFKISVPANATWADTGIDMLEGQKATFTASGKWCLDNNPDQSLWCDWKGYEKMRSPKVPLKDEPVCCLIGRLGDSPPLFVLHKTAMLTADKTARLYFGPNAAPPPDTAGTIVVTVSISFK